MKIPARNSRLLKAVTVVVAAMTIFSLLPASPASAATTTVTAGGVYSYTEQQGPIGVGSGITITNGTAYDGEYVDFAVSGSTSHDILSLLTDDSPSTASGVVSVVGTSVYLGNGTIAEPLGSIDSTFDGKAGRKLRVNFTTAFTNPGFETGDTLGWTAMKQQIDLGVTNIAGFVANDTSTYPGTAPNKDNNVPSSATWSVGPVTTGQPTEGTYALQLQSQMTTAQGCDVVHGPAAYSGEFEAAAGDKIYFDWRAFSGDDAYSVFGYIVDRNGVQTEVLDTFSTSSTNTNWTTKETVIPTGGHYRFVFVAGTFDATCGRAAGASLLIDNVRVYGSKANDNVAQQIARKLQFENTSDNPAAQRTITVTAKSASNGTGSDTITVNITPVDDPMTASDPADIVYTNDAPTGETFSPISGQVAVVDPDTSSFNFSLTGSSAVSATIDGKTYDRAITTDYGTLYLDSSTGRYAFDPDSAAIDSRMTDDVDTFTVTVSAGEFSDTATITMRVDIPESVTQAPTGLSATAGQQSVSLDWTTPSWTGGSAITGYHIYKSIDGSNWTTVIADTGSTETTYTVTGLDAGTEYIFRVAAINGTGTSTPSLNAAATPYTTPGAVAITSVTEDDSSLSVTFAEPADDGSSAIIGYEISTDGGTTWTDAGTTAGTVVISPLENGSTYEVVVRAVNTAGPGESSSSVSATPRTIPGSPSVDSVTETDGTLTVAFSAPSDDGGAAITGYEVSIDDGATWQPVDDGAMTVTLTGLANGTTYGVRVRAINEAGAGDSNASVPATPRTTADAPTITRITAGSHSLAIQIAAPADDGGAAITKYEISLDNGITWTTSVDVGTNPIQIFGLVNGTTYPVKVRAVNAAGSGAASTSVPGTPVAAPIYPSNGPGSGGSGSGSNPSGSGSSFKVAPGKTLVTINGKPTVVDAFTVPGSNAIVVSGDDWTATIGGLDENGNPMEIDSHGRLIVLDDGSVRVTGSGYAPGSTVDVWLFSTPILLGEFTVRADGTFDEVLPLPPGTPLGEHTLQLNGVGTNGEVQSVSAGLIIQAKAAAERAAANEGAAANTPTATNPLRKLAFTGSNVLMMMLWAMAAVGTGTTLESITRRRRRGTTLGN